MPDSIKIIAKNFADSQNRIDKSKSKKKLNDLVASIN
jgi:hypothetical protein